MAEHDHLTDVDIDAVLTDPDGPCPCCVRLLVDHLCGYAEEAAKAVAAAQDQATLARERDEARAELEQLRARVRALHRQVCAGRCGGMPDYCGCPASDTVCETCHETWPCPTITICGG